MDVRLSPEQRALRDAAAQLVDRLGPESVAALDDAERAAKLDAALEATGWRELRSADEDGSPLASTVEVSLVAEELARGLADVSYAGPSLAAELRRLAGAPPALGRETVALTADLAALATSDDAGLTPGALAVDAAGAGAVLAITPDGTVLRAELAPQPRDGLDLTRSTVVADMHATEPLPGSLTPDALDRWTAFALAVSSAELVGTMRGAVALAVGHARDRRQYGAPIGSFQAVQHLLADAHVATEGSRSVALHAAWAVDALPPDQALRAAAVAKAYCSRAARSVCETAIQVHGGIGNTWECLAHVHLRRALLSSDLLGGAALSLDRVLAAYGIGDTHGLR